ncbi:MAG: prepilin peptidase [Candidatus Eremiobacteraeota bacterium]|nr:prepilin peptidase [Candidatus Eremiobacteraeota bacterium]
MQNLQNVFGGPFVTYATLTVGIVACAVATVTDVRTRRVPNWLTFPTMGLALSVASTRGIAPLFCAVTLILVAIACGLVLHGIGLLGGGDVKLLIGICVLVGLPNCAALLVYTALAGGALALCVSLYHGRIIALSKRVARSFAVMVMTKSIGAGRDAIGATNGERLPYAVAIAAGFALLVLSKSYCPTLRIPL